ncbi:MAG: hypothetical protein LUG64_07690, partial [Clostridiales bacterium]|nr:hypothetical protein [Clostridiales bacterium]
SFRLRVICHPSWLCSAESAADNINNIRTIHAVCAASAAFRLSEPPGAFLVWHPAVFKKQLPSGRESIIFRGVFQAVLLERSKIRANGYFVPKKFRKIGSAFVYFATDSAEGNRGSRNACPAGCLKIGFFSCDISPC